MQRPRNFDCLCCSFKCSSVLNCVTKSLKRFSLMAASRSQVDPKGLARGAGTKRVLSALPLRGPQHVGVVGLALTGTGTSRLSLPLTRAQTPGKRARPEVGGEHRPCH